MLAEKLMWTVYMCCCFLSRFWHVRNPLLQGIRLFPGSGSVPYGLARDRDSKLDFVATHGKALDRRNGILSSATSGLLMHPVGPTHTGDG